MKRALIQRSGAIQPKSSRRRTHGYKLLAASAVAAIGGMTWVQSAPAATLTWIGNVVDPTSGGGAGSYTPSPTPSPTMIDPLPADPARWTTDSTNWSGGTYAAQSDLVFFDNFSGLRAIRLSSSNLNPKSMTFKDAGAGATNYVFLAGAGAGPADYSYNAGVNFLSSSTPLGASNPGTTITLDTGFTGKVELRVGGANSTGAATASNTIIRSGILQLDASNTLPGTNTQKPFVELAGGSLYVQGNLASSQLAGTMTVSDDSLMAMVSSTTAFRVWNGVLNIAAGKTLSIQALNDISATDFNQYNVHAQPTFSGSLGRLLLVDGATPTRFQIETGSAAAAGSATMIWDLGVGQSKLMFNQTGTLSMGALTSSGTNQFIRGVGNSTTALTLSVGALNTSTTYTGGIVENIVTGGTATTNLTKVGVGTLTLTGVGVSNGTYNSYAGTTTVSGGSVVLTSNATIASGAGATINLGTSLVLDNTTTNVSNRLSDTGPVTMNGGTLQYNANGSGTNEVTGSLTLNSGQNHINATGNGTLTFAGLIRNSGGGAVDFAPGSVAVNLASPPTPVNGIIGGFATYNGTDWAAMSGTQVVAYSGYTDSGNGSDPSTWGATQNIRVTATGVLTASASAVANSIKMAGAGGSLTIPAANSLTIGTGGLLSVVDTSISGPGNLTAGTTVSPAELLANAAAGTTLTINAPITNNGAGGTVSFTKLGAGKVILGAGSANTYTGATSLNEGTLQAGAANLFSGNLSINNNTTFDIGGFNQNISALTVVNGSLANSGSPSATVTATALTVQNGTVGAKLAGTATLNKTNPGTVTLTAQNTYTGGTSVVNGTLVAGVAQAFPSGSAMSITGGGTVDVGAFNQTLGALTLGVSASTGASSGNLLGTSGIVTPTSTDMEQGNVTAIIGGSVAFNKNGTVDNHTVTLGNQQQYTGGTNIVSGTLATTVNDALPVGKDVTLSNSGVNPRLDIGSTDQHIGTLILEVPNSADNAIRGTSGTLYANVFDLRNGQVPANIGGSGTVTKSTGGTVRLSGNNTYTNDTVVTGGGALTVSNENSLGALTNSLRIDSNSTLQATSNVNSPNRSVIIGSGGAAFTGPLTAGTNGNMTFANMDGVGNAMTKSGSGTLTVNHLRVGDVTINAGTVQIAASGGAFTATSKIGNLVSNGLINLQDNKLITTATVGTWDTGLSVYTGVTGMVASGRGTGNLWDGTTGIVTTQSNAVGSNLTSIGVAKASDVRPATATATALWGGQTITGTDTLVMYTYGGDANLDGKINIDDYIKTDAGFAAGSTGWSNGDFNYDGKVNIDDYLTIIDPNFANQNGVFPTGGGIAGGGGIGVSAVPEPATLSLLGLGATALLGRRRRNRR